MRWSARTASSCASPASPAAEGGSEGDACASSARGEERGEGTSAGPAQTEIGATRASRRSGFTKVSRQARAWKWRRQLESGAMSTIQDIAVAENVSDRFIGRMIRLAYLAPSVLEALVIARRPLAIAVNDLMTVAELPWDEQIQRAFG